VKGLWWGLFALIVSAAMGLGVWAVARAHGKDDWPVPEAAKKVRNPLPVTPEGLAAARELYSTKCSRCHGDTGKGDGDEADMYDPKPADLTDAHRMHEVTDGEIFYKISEGHDPMPAFKQKLSDEDRWRLVNYVRTLCAAQNPPSAPPAAPRNH
jgi:mono/diheme cytochrome c family protein